MTVSYKCPTCGAALEFDPESGKVSCGHCGYQSTVAEMSQNAEQEETFEKAEQVEKEGETGTFKVYRCPSCGAEMLTDDYTSATICGFCGTPGLMEDRLSGQLKPTFVLPFRLDKEAAIAQFKTWTKGNILTPRGFSSQSTLEKITGLYVPFWLYDYDANVQLNAHCTRVRVSRQGNTEYTYTDHFEVLRDINVEYDNIPTDASEKMEDGVMDLLEPFDFSELKQFEMPYLSGYLSERYTYTSDELQGRAKNRARNFAIQSARNTIQGYTGVSVVNQQLRIRELREDYVLLPVWMLNYRYQNKNYQLAINGQTGKQVGTLPVSGGRAAGLFGAVTAAAFVLLTLIGGLM